MILDLARNNIEQSQRMGFVQGDPGAIMIVEYAGETDDEVRGKIDALDARRQRERFGYAAHVAHDTAEQASIWKLRKAGLGLLLGMKGDKKPIAFVEDTAVAPQHLAEFVSRFREIFAKHETEGAYYGHCSVGCLHIRPVIDLKTPRGLEQVRRDRRRDHRSGGASSTARSRASTATAGRAARSSSACTARGSCRPSASSSAPSTRTTA